MQLIKPFTKESTMKKRLKNLYIGDVIKVKKGTRLGLSIHGHYSTYLTLNKKITARVKKINNQSISIEIIDLVVMFRGTAALESNRFSCRIPFKYNKGLKLKIVKDGSHQ
jgi:hypothetical protein